MDIIGTKTTNHDQSFTVKKTLSYNAGWPNTPYEINVKVLKADGSWYVVWNRFKTEAERAHWLKWS